MNDITDLVQQVYDHFARRFGGAGGEPAPGDLFLAFEAVGTGVARNDFKLLSGDPEFNPGLVAAHGADLVNFVPQFGSDRTIQPRGDLSPRLDEQYWGLLSQATHRATAGGNNGLDEFLELQGRAKRRFEINQPDLDGAGAAPATLSPRHWFDDQDSNIWTRYDSTISSHQDEVHPVPAPPRPILAPQAWSWRPIAPAARPSLERAVRFRVSPAIAEATDGSPVRMAPIALARATTPVAPFAGRGFDRRSARTLAAATPPETPITLVRPPAVLRRSATTDLVRSRRLREVALRETVAALPEKHVTSQRLAVSFDYCLVDISRDWLSPEFLSAKSWTIAGMEPGELSSGSYSTERRPLGFLPAKFIAIKGLRIEAEWSQEDRMLARDSVGLGPFSLIDGSFENNVLACPGVQIVGWFSQVLPVLPPSHDL